MLGFPVPEWIQVRDGYGKDRKINVTEGVFAAVLRRRAGLGATQRLRWVDPFRLNTGVVGPTVFRDAGSRAQPEAGAVRPGARLLGPPGSSRRGAGLAAKALGWVKGS